jgi:hypothetical protein
MALNMKSVSDVKNIRAGAGSLSERITMQFVDLINSFESKASTAIAGTMAEQAKKTSRQAIADMKAEAINAGNSILNGIMGAFNSVKTMLEESRKKGEELKKAAAERVREALLTPEQREFIKAMEERGKFIKDLSTAGIFGKEADKMIKQFDEMRREPPELPKIDEFTRGLGQEVDFARVSTEALASSAEKIQRDQLGRLIGIEKAAKETAAKVGGGLAA